MMINNNYNENDNYNKDDNSDNISWLRSWIKIFEYRSLFVGHQLLAWNYI